MLPNNKHSYMQRGARRKGGKRGKGETRRKRRKEEGRKSKEGGESSQGTVCPKSLVHLYKPKQYI